MNKRELLDHLDDIWTFGHELTDADRRSIRAAMDLIEKIAESQDFGCTLCEVEADKNFKNWTPIEELLPGVGNIVWATVRYSDYYDGIPEGEQWTNEEYVPETYIVCDAVYMGDGKWKYLVEPYSGWVCWDAIQIEQMKERDRHMPYATILSWMPRQVPEPYRLGKE